MKSTDGSVIVFGASASSTGGHQLSPNEITPANGYDYEGDILKMTGGASNSSNVQFAVLTTDGMYYWGSSGYLVTSNVKSGSGFGKTNAIGTYGESGVSAYGLPKDVNPEDVKMLFGTYRTLALVTCTGEAWVMAYDYQMFGDGVNSPSGDNRYVWHRVMTDANTPLENVVALRGNTRTLMALTVDGKIYTWGRNVYKGDGTPKIDTQLFALEMTAPAAGKIKQIGAATGSTSGNSYYALMTDGRLYSLGYNSDRQLGDFTTSERRSWVQPLQTNGGNPITDIAWISPNEHSASSSSSGYAAMNVLTNDGKMWSWGRNSNSMLGSGSSRLDPTYMIGGLDAQNDVIMAVETGGHTTVVIKECSERYGYIGHSTYGSMGDGTSTSKQENTFNFSETATINLCGAPTAPVVEDLLKICQGTTADLNDAMIVGENYGNLKWFRDEALTDELSSSEITEVGVGTYYVIDDNNICTDAYAIVNVQELSSEDACEDVCYEDVEGEFKTWYYGNNPGFDIVKEGFTQPGTNAGFTLDIYYLDNSFNMEINDTGLYDDELEFQKGISGSPQNVRFKSDGAMWQDGNIKDIWKFYENETITEANKDDYTPVIRVEIYKNGNAQLFGIRDEHGGLEELEVFDPSTGSARSLNTVNWHTTENEIKVSQNVEGVTAMTVYGSGKNIKECDFFDLEKDGVFDDNNEDGFAQAGETITYTFDVINAGDMPIHDVKIIDPLLGYTIELDEITHQPTQSGVTLTGDNNDNGVLDVNEIWTFTVKYKVTKEDIFENKGVYNRATVTGVGKLKNSEFNAEENSIDPTPYTDQDEGWDPTRPDHTYVPLKGSGLIITNPMIYQRMKTE